MTTPPAHYIQLQPPPNLLALRSAASRRRSSAGARPPRPLSEATSTTSTDYESSSPPPSPRRPRAPYVAAGGWAGVEKLAAYGRASSVVDRTRDERIVPGRPASGETLWRGSQYTASMYSQYSTTDLEDRTRSGEWTRPSLSERKSLSSPGFGRYGEDDEDSGEQIGRSSAPSRGNPQAGRAGPALQAAGGSASRLGQDGRRLDEQRSDGGVSPLEPSEDQKKHFSFLYEEEPPRRSRQSFGGTGTLKKKASGLPSRNSLAFLRKDIFPSAPRRAPTPTASLEGPRQPSQIFRTSSDLSLLPADQAARLTGEHRRHDSVDSMESSDSNPNYAPGSRARDFGFYNEPSNDSSDSMLGSAAPMARAVESQLSPEAEKRNRLRLAEFLSETATAMEGGKSLAMVHPETFDDSRSSSEIPPGATAGLRPRGASTRSRSSTAGSSRSTETTLPGANGTAALAPRPSTSRLASAATIVAPSDATPNRRTRYFTPVLASEPQFATVDDDSGEASGELSADSDAAPDVGDELERVLEQVRRDQAAPRDLGLGLDISAGGRSPSTLRAGSPSFSGTSHSGRIPAEKTDSAAASIIAVGDDEVARARAKMVDRRGRIICELIETEAAFASDMAVVRDIFLARARGCDMAAVADHVMSSGLGLGNIVGECPPSPPPSATSAHFPQLPPTSRNNQRRPTLIRRPSGALEMPRGDMETCLISEKDIHIIFANLDEIAGFAEAFSGLLDGAWTTGAEDDMADRIGEAFITMIPRIQKIFSSYCARHHRAIVRLQELEPSLRAYLAECKTLSHGRTNAWDLASLLIKPVQRCLKYPLLLDQILTATPADHPDRPNLERANREMLNVAEQINDFKKRSDVVGRIVNKRDLSQRRDTATSVTGSFGRSVTKKLMRGSQRAKQAVGLADQERDEMFDTLSDLVDSARSGVLRFSSEMREWSRTTKAALDAQVTLVEAWMELYSPMETELRVEGGGHHRLCVFLDTVLRPVIAGPCRDFDLEIRRNLDLKTEHLLSLFENPRSVVAKRNDKMLDHSRYLAKHLPQDKRGSEDFLTLTAQLLEELPRFLGQVSRYFNIIIVAYANTQATYFKAVQEAWSTFADDWFTQIPDGSYSTIEDAFAEKHGPLAQMMEKLAQGLQIPSSHPLAGRSPSSVTDATSSTQRQSSSGAPLSSARSSGFAEYSISSLRSSSSVNVNRTSQHSDSSAPSFVMSSAASSSLGSAETPSPLNWSTGRPVFPAKFGETAAQSLEGNKRTSYLSDSSSDIPGGGTMQPGPRVGKTIDDAQRLVTTLSVYLPNEPEVDSDDEPVLYIAEAASASKSTALRDGYPIMSFELGDALHVIHEEADSEQGGSGWLMGRKDDGALGWARSEDFMLREVDSTA